MEARIFIDDSDFERLSRLFAGAPALFKKAARTALRRAGGNMRKNIAQGMRGASYLKGRSLTGAIGKLKISDGEASVKVSGPKAAAHKFKMAPSRITARKGSRSVNWPSPGVSVGPGEPVKHLRVAGFSKPFIAKTKNAPKVMLMREKGTGKLKPVRPASPQYFAAFDRVQQPALDEAARAFRTRLEHEIDYRLGLGK